MPSFAAWTAAAILLMIGLIPCGIVCIRSNFENSLAAYEMASVLAILSIVALGEAFGRSPWFDLAIAMALLSLPAGLVFAVFLDRWL